MNKKKYYKASDKMSDLICSNYALLQVMSRFGLSIGFGDKTVEEVCLQQNVDCQTFLSVVNFILNEDMFHVDLSNNISIRALMHYLAEAHKYFLDYQLPAIREKLVVFLEYSDNKEVCFLIMNFFDAYIDELKRHMGYEEEYVFKYVESLLAKRKDPKHVFSEIAGDHNQVDTKLTELKDIIIKYLPTTDNNFHINSMLFDIFACIEDLDSHSRVEDCMFAPAVLKLEKEMRAE